MTLAFPQVHSYRVVHEVAPDVNGWPMTVWRSECTCRRVTVWRPSENDARLDGGDHWRESHDRR